MPYVGDITNASVYILMLNPGFRPLDYYAEQESSEYIQALKSGLHQTGYNKYPFYFLDPRFSWTGGGSYWNQKLGAYIKKIISRDGITYQEAAYNISHKIAVLELVPYHSSHFKLPKKEIKKLKSVKLMRDYVTSYVLPRSRKNEACIIVTRKNNYWRMKEEMNIVVYTGGQTRGAYLTENSPAANVLDKFLL